jgi:drug/metabolite transporter (DMT)-like permease
VRDRAAGFMLAAGTTRTGDGLLRAGNDLLHTATAFCVRRIRRRVDRRTGIALVTVQVLFGLLPVASKVALDGMHPIVLIAVRTAGAALLLAPLHFVLVRRPVKLSRDGVKVAFLAVFGIIVNQGFFIVGLTHTTATNAAIMITTIPVFTYAVAVVARRETVGPRRAAGIALALLGAVYLIGLSGFEASRETAFGDLLVALNSLSFSIYLVFSKPLTERADALSLTTWLFVVGAVVFVPAGLSLGMTDQIAALEGRRLLAVVFIVLGPTVTTYVLNNVALSRVPSSSVAVFVYLQPLFAGLAAALILSERVTWRLVPAAALIFAGVWLVSRRRPKVLEGEPVAA